MFDAGPPTVDTVKEGNKAYKANKKKAFCQGG